MFKYIFAICTFILFTLRISAQSPSISVFSGIDYSKIKFFDFTASGHQNIIEDQFSFPSLLFGVQASHDLSKKMVAQISFHYTHKKEILQTDFGFDPNLYTKSLEFKSIISRFGINYLLIKDLYIGMGIQSRYIFDAQKNIVNGTVDEAEMNKNNLGLFLSAQYNLKSFIFEVAYSRGVNMDHNDLKYRFFDTVERIQSLEFKLGYRLLK